MAFGAPACPNGESGRSVGGVLISRAFRRGLSILGIFFVVMVLTPVAVGATVLAAYLFLPLPPTLPDPLPTVDAQLTRLYDINGDEIGIFRQFDSSIPVEREDIPQVLKDAVVAAEDRNFYNHGGVDFRGTLRALWADLRNREAVQGGSTITQQYVKNAYTGSDRTLTRKFREAILASQLDRQIPKDEILFRYLSQIYFGEGAYGIGAAAETYFRKPVQELNLSESAMLAGLIPAPSRYSPRADPFTAESRRVRVLDTMLDEDLITPAEHSQAANTPLFLVALGEPTVPSTLVYPPEESMAVHPWFQDYVRRYVEARLGEGSVYTDGLRIETTLDPVVQFAATTSVNEALDGVDPTVEMGVAAVEPPTGYLRAMVGGRDFAASQVNRALGAAGGGTDRSPGSSFKPFVLATAFDQGITPDATYSGASHQVPGTLIGNYGGGRFGTINLRTATHKSVNTVFTRLILDVGVEETFDMVNRLGLDTPPYDPSVYGAAVAIGGLEVSPLEMASAYGVFAARGRRAEPTPVLRVLDTEGNVLIDNTEPDMLPVLEPAVADNVTDVLRGVLDPGGTAGGRGLDRPAAGKTGTSQDAKDAWFVGFTPTLSTAVWIGRDQPSPLTGIGGFNELTGGSIPARTWQRFMEAALADVPVTDFNEPAPIVSPLDEEQRRRRGGFDVGTRRPIEETPIETYAETMNEPAVEAPAPSTTLPPVSAPSSSTSTTTPGLFDPDDDDDGGLFGRPNG
ncbi:penicillin-binding protein 1A [soil metagenome]